VQQVYLVPWRVPGYQRAPLPLTDSAGRFALAHDLFPMAAAWLGGLCSLRRTRERWGSVVFYTALLGVSALAYTRLDVGERSGEVHRFMTAAMLSFPWVGALWLAPRPGHGRRSGATALGTALVVAAVGLSAVSTLEWWRTKGKTECRAPSVFGSTESFFETSCRAETGAKLGEPAAPRYGAPGVNYLVLGCRPSFAAAAPPGKELADRVRGPKKWVVSWPFQTGMALSGKRALAELDAHVVRPGAPLVVDCPATASKEIDAACRFALERDRCRPSGSKLVECELDARERGSVLRGWNELSREPSGPAEPSSEDAPSEADKP
jgi:hypothetical protein